MESFGRYELHDQLGQGGMGVVYRAHDTVLQRVVALKLVAVSYVDDPEMRERFFREARAAAQLTHKNIVTVYDLGEHDGRPYLAMEYLAGEDLQRRLSRPDRIPLSRRIEVALEICHGVEHAHAHGIIHRDLKPANIYLAENGGVKILDFGLARPMSSQLTHSNMLMGTINYMAPEQVRGERADQRSDIFSLGVVLYELFGGRKAFEGDSVASTLYKILESTPEPLSKLDTEIPPAVWRIVERALAKNREDRYQQVSALIGDLQEVAHPAPVSIAQSQIPLSSPWGGVGSSVRPASGPPISTVPAQPQPPAPTRAARLPMIASVVAIVAIGVAGTAWFMAHRTHPPAAETTGSVPVNPAPPPQVQTPPPTVPPAPQPSAQSPPGGSTAADKTAASAEGASIAARQQAEAARGRMTEGRSAAEAAGAPASAAAAFRNAVRRAQDADRLFKSRKFDEAAARYYEATGLFRDAEAAARSGAPAPRPTAPSEPAPQRLPQQSVTPPGTGVALPPPPAPPAAPAAPTPSPSAGAASQPSAAAPSRQAPPPQAAPSGPSDDERVTELVNRYRDALEARSLDRMKQIWPSLSGASENALREEFQHASRISVEISPPQIALNGGSGRVTFTRNYALVTLDGQRLQSSSHVTMDVRRAGSGWVIESVRFSPR
ncbi:MAG TPA: protein kinase [Vicinamibacterales bacterium]|nr:protein kinase [Vicinamibacterales bacterium]